MERAIKKRLYVYTIGMFLATVVVVSVITIYYEYRVRYMATTLYGVNKEAGKQLLYILFYGRQGHTGTADYSAILQEAGYTRNGAWYMFLYGRRIYSICCNYWNYGYTAYHLQYIIL